MTEKATFGAGCFRGPGSNLHTVPVVTEVEPAADFWRAEDYHQQYPVNASCLI